MKNYKVTIEFKTDPAFSAEVTAVSEPAAKGCALLLARECGYYACAQSVTVVERVSV